MLFDLSFALFARELLNVDGAHPGEESMSAVQAVQSEFGHLLWIQQFRSILETALGQPELADSAPLAPHAPAVNPPVNAPWNLRLARAVSNVFQPMGMG